MKEGRVGRWAKMIGRPTLQVSEDELKVIGLAFSDGADSPCLKVGPVKSYYASEAEYFVGESSWKPEDRPPFKTFYGLLSESGKNLYLNPNINGEWVFGDGVLLAAGLDKTKELHVFVSCRERNNEYKIIVDLILPVNYERVDFQKFRESVIEESGSNFDIGTNLLGANELILRREIDIRNSEVSGVSSSFFSVDNFVPGSHGFEDLGGYGKTNFRLGRVGLGHSQIKLFEDARLMLGEIVQKMAVALRESGTDVPDLVNSTELER